MAKIVLRAGRVLDPAAGVDRRVDLFVAGNRIAALGRAPTGFKTATEIDATDQVICPGFVDLRARLREPGEEFKATMASELRAAVAGGFTTVVCAPDTDPPIDTPATVSLVRERAASHGLARVLPLGAMIRAGDGVRLSEMAALRAAGVAGMAPGRDGVDALVMRRAMEYAASFGMPVVVRPEEAALAAGGCMHEGELSTRLGLPGIPAEAESIAVQREVALARLTGARLHLGPLSARQSLAPLAAARAEKLPVTADVAAHQLVMTEQAVASFDANCHLRPPLRGKEDRDALCLALTEGVIDAICSDHQPHEIDAKSEPFARTEPGISSFETVLPLVLRLVREQTLDLSRAVELLTAGPARVLGIEAGTLASDAVADICVFDPLAHWQVEEGAWFSAGLNTPFRGTELIGRVTQVLVDGRRVYRRDGRAGRHLSRARR